jgi:hypothetical protein
LDNSNASSEILMIEREISAWNANMILSNYQF